MVDSLLAIKQYVYDEKTYTFAQIKDALVHNFEGKKEYEIMQARLINKAQKYGNDESEADELARVAMDYWAQETYQ